MTFSYMRASLFKHAFASAAFLLATLPVQITPGGSHGTALAQDNEYADTRALVTFGPAARRIEGDHDFRQFIRFSAPEDAGALYLRVFDPDNGGKHDETIGFNRGHTRFSLYGAGSDMRLWRDEDGVVQENVEGEAITSVEFGTDPDIDDTWQGLFVFDSEDGKPTGDGRREFVLAVEGVDGDGGNVFDVAVSTSETGNVQPDALEIYSYMPTFQVSRRGTFVELRFRIPDSAKSLVVENYDSAGGHVAYAGRFRTVPIDASRKSEWSRSRVELDASEPGRMGSVTMAEGGETPNDVTVFIGAPVNGDDAVEQPVAIELPLRVFAPYPRPEAAFNLQPGVCGDMTFDASASLDPRGGPLAWSWRLNDGDELLSGAEIQQSFEEPGDYPARLEVFNESGMIASGSATDFSFFVKPPPVARLEAPILVAQGADVLFDGTGSTTQPRPNGNHISRYHWRMGDGGEVVQNEGDPDFGKPVYIYENHGVFTVELTVTDSAGNPCDSTSVTHQVTVNAKPLAETGGDRRIAFGDVIAFDAGDPTGPDGDTHQFAWDFGDGATATGAKVEHTYQKPGTYAVSLRVDDGKGAENSISTDTSSVFVNASPDGAAAVIPDMMQPNTPEIFDASGAFDSDGEITAIEWSFSDGVTTDKTAFKHMFRDPGDYTVTLKLTDDSNLGNAVTEITKTISVPDPGNIAPVADPGGDRQALVGEIVTFDGSASSDADGSILDYRWDFGDGQVGDRLTVDHAYHKPGAYTVTLEVTDDSGRENATSAASFTIVVANRDNQSPIVTAGGDRAAFVNEIIEFDASASIDVDGNLMSVDWDFGDGGVASGKTAFHSYAEPGDYLVSVIVSDDSGLRGAVTARQFTVAVTHAPNEAPRSDIPQTLRLKTKVPHQFDASAAQDPDGNIISFAWDFGDGGASHRPVVDHVYDRPGVYEGSLTLTDDSGLPSGVTVRDFKVYVEKKPNEAPIAEAGADITAIVGERVDFDGGASTDADSSIVSYHWDFGNGKTAIGQKRSIAYFDPGTYEVVLTVTDNSGQANASGSDNLTVTVNDRPNTMPVARVPKDRPAAIDEAIEFSAAESEDPDGNILSYEWDFGDGNTATGREVSHLYEKSGTYVARLTIRDDSGLENQNSISERTIVINEPPVAEAGPDQHVTASEVIFDASQSYDLDGEIISYEWDFGDGQRGTGQMVAHTYRAPGVYDVGLYIVDSSGTIRNDASDTMTVIVNALPVADAGFDVVTAPGETLTFDGRRSSDPDGEIARYLWNFRDGNEAQGDVVSHAFSTPGYYSVELRIYDDTGHEEATDFSQILITVNDQPTAEAGPDLSVAPGEAFILSGAGSTDRDGSITSWRWDIQNTEETLEGETVEHSFEEPGIYTITLTVTDDSIASNRTAQDELTVEVNHEPVAEAGHDIVSDQLRIVFNAGASADPDNDGLTYMWDFGDGSKAAGAEVEHVYETGGVYPVLLTTDDGRGLANSTDTDALTVSINRTPVAVAGDDKQACVGDIFVFDASSSVDPDNGLLLYEWDFGDGNTSTIINPTKVYEDPGVFRVRLSVRDESGLANATHSDEALMTVLPAPEAHAGADIEVCAGTPIRFDGTESSDVDGVVNRFSWDFGDGQTGGGDRPEHIYYDAGVYRVSLQIEGDNLGLCSPISTDDIQVTVLQAPVAVVNGPTSVAAGEEVTFDGFGSSLEGGVIAAYEWDFGDGLVASGGKVSHVFEKPGLYHVRLQASATEDLGGCASTETIHLVTVNAAPMAQIDAAPVIEVNKPLVLSGAGSSDPDGGISEYAWNLGDGDVASGVEIRHIWREPGLYAVTLKVDDGTGLANAADEALFEVTVLPAPASEIDGPAIACVGEPAPFALTNLPEGADSSRAAWTFGDGSGAEGETAAHAYAKSGVYSVNAILPVERAGEVLQTPVSRSITINRPPVAIIDVVRKTCAGEDIVFEASRSFDPDGEAIAYHWDFGDGTVAEGPTAEHSYGEPGSYRAVLTVTDATGSQCAATEQAVEIFVNAPPVADAGPDIDLLIGGAHDSLVLDAGRSTDADGDHLEYYWILSNGLELDGEKARVEFSEPGVVEVELTAGDPHGLACSISTDVMTIRTRTREASTTLSHLE